MRPRFTVLINNYNYGRYIGTAIESVLDQSFTDFELIVIDDGSKDNSHEAINSYTDKRLQVIFQENGGQAAALNAGFSKAQGHWIALLDSDDWWEPNKLQRLDDYIRLIGEGYALVQHLLNDWLDGEETPCRNILPVGDVWRDIQATRSLNHFVPTTGLVFPAEIAHKILPIPLEFRFSADAYLMRTAVLHGKVFSIPEVLGYHRLHAESFTSGVIKDPLPFIKEVLFPHLNAYYARNGADFRFISENCIPRKRSALSRALHRFAPNIFR